MVNQEARAYKTWNILTELAPHSRPTTYEELATKLGTHALAVRYVLSLIQDYCRDNGRPPLTILVINKQSQEPGEGFTAWGHENLQDGRTEVRNHDWAREPNPFAYAADGTTDDDLVNRLLTTPEKSQEVYAKVKVRGMAQKIFRSALLKAYNGRCAFSGASFVETLDAAHIIPWSRCTPDLKMNPQNGILMLCCHHRLFDLGILSVDEDFRIVFTNKNGSTLTETDKLLVEKLHGESVALPTNPLLRPGKHFIRRRNAELGQKAEINAIPNAKGRSVQ